MFIKLYTHSPRTGRARQQDSAFVILREDSNRTVNDLHVAEQHQSAVIAGINQRGVHMTAEIHARMAQAQQSRKRNAAAVLSEYFAPASTGNKRSALSALNLYAMKVSGEVSMREAKQPSGAGWRTVASLVQFGEATLQGEGGGATKKEATQCAADKLLQLLHNA